MSARKPEGLTVRPIESRDARDISRIARQAGVLPTTLGLPSDRVADLESFIDRLTVEDHYLVAELDGVVTGLAGLSVGTGRLRHSGRIHLYVDETHHNRGIGSALLDAVLSLADDWLLLHRLDLTVLVANQPARHLYERAGFVTEGRRRDSVVSEGDFADEFLMARIRPPGTVVAATKSERTPDGEL